METAPLCWFGIGRGGLFGFAEDMDVKPARATRPHHMCCFVRRLQRCRDVLQLTDELTELFPQPVEGQPFTQCACESSRTCHRASRERESGAEQRRSRRSPQSCAEALTSRALSAAAAIFPSAASLRTRRTSASRCARTITEHGK
jgi:hypothetical protein